MSTLDIVQLETCVRPRAQAEEIMIIVMVVMVMTVVLVTLVLMVAGRATMLIVTSACVGASWLVTSNVVQQLV